MTETRFYTPGTIPEHTTPEWYAGREHAPHLEQPAHRERLLLAADFANRAIWDYNLKTVSDMGAGDGGLLTLIQDAKCWGYDLMPANVVAAHARGVHTTLTDVIADQPAWGDLAVCTEMLEHLVDPHAFVRRAFKQSRAIVASSPNGETEASHYEFHTWGWSMDGYRAMFEDAGWTVIRHETVGGFQVLLGVRP